jgi:hypothetical protein
VGFSERAQPLPVVYFGWPRFPVPGSAPRMGAGPIQGLTVPRMSVTLPSGPLSASKLACGGNKSRQAILPLLSAVNVMVELSHHCRNRSSPFGRGPRQRSAGVSCPGCVSLHLPKCRNRVRLRREASCWAFRWRNPPGASPIRIPEPFYGAARTVDQHTCARQPLF